MRYLTLLLLSLFATAHASDQDKWIAHLQTEPLSLSVPFFKMDGKAYQLKLTGKAAQLDAATLTISPLKNPPFYLLAADLQFNEQGLLQLRLPYLRIDAKDDAYQWILTSYDVGASFNLEAANRQAITLPPFPRPRSQNSSNLSETHNTFNSNGVPNHFTGRFPNFDWAYSILLQDYTLVIPRTGKKADKPSPLHEDIIGIAINGVPFFNANTALDPVAGAIDNCGGRPDAQGRYHYVRLPTCLLNEMPGKHSSIIGYARDGFFIYGTQGFGGVPPTNLDACNGHTERNGYYHYHVSENYPYSLGCYTGKI
jgi:hypothetical protein